MTRKEAEQGVLKEWRSWVTRENITDPKAYPDGLRFFFYLRQNRSDLLRFRYPGDRWQEVKAWLHLPN